MKFSVWKTNSKEMPGPPGPPGPSGDSGPETVVSEGGGPSEPGPRTTHRPDDGKIDAEFDRFFACAVPTPNGLGLYDPDFGPDMPRGITGEQWDAFVCDVGRLGRGSRA